MSIPKISLEQWATFRSVVDEGSFAKAAEALNKSQSTVSYTISRLNDLLPSPALTLEGRKAVLTELGKALYRHASHLLDQADQTEQIARIFGRGWEDQIALVTDALTPMSKVFRALDRFSQTCPSTRFKILETSLSGTDEALFNRQCDLAISPRVPPGFMGDPLTSIKMIAVAHKDHPLAKQTDIDENELRRHRQMVVRDSGTKREQNAGWLGSDQRWTVSHFASSIEAVLNNFAFAFLPKHRVKRYLENGQMVELQLKIGRERRIPLSLIQCEPQLAGPGTQALVKILNDVFQTSDA